MEVIEVIDITSDDENVNTAIEIIDIISDDDMRKKEKYLLQQIESSKELTKLFKTLSGNGIIEGQFNRDILEELMKLVLDLEKQFLVEFWSLF